MSWTCTTAGKALIAALNTDILYEIEMADDCLWRVDSASQQHRASVRHRAEHCAAAAVRNATALAAEVLVLGGVPPGAGPQRRSNRLAAESIEEYVARAQLAVRHYQRRMAMAERLGLARLREVFQEVVRGKRRHLAHASLIAAAGLSPRQLS
ncbi:MAG: hypothetical protein WB579_07660 [Bryobacteraceae bacterium]